MIWLLISVILICLILLTPIGVSFKWENTKFKLKIQVGFLFFSLKKQEKKPPKEKKTSARSKLSQPKKKKRVTLDDVLFLLSKSKRLLRRIQKSIHVRKFRLFVVAGGTDPATTAKLYGMICAMSSAILPLIHSWKPKYHLDLDLNSSHFSTAGAIRVNVRIGSILLIALSGAALALSWLLHGRRRVPATA
jgi:hypothetical protein